MRVTQENRSQLAEPASQCLELGLHSVTASSTPQESLAGCSTTLIYREAPAKMPEASVAIISGTTPQYMPDSTAASPFFRVDQCDQMRHF